MGKQMTEEQKARLKDIPASICSVCKSKRSYGNPMMKCFNCKRKVCYDHGLCTYELKGQKENEEQKDVCLACFKKLKV